MAEETKGKTWKRELAVVLLLWFAYLVETKDEHLIEILVWPVFTYSAISFGLQWVSPNGRVLQPRGTEVSHRGRSESRSQRPSGEDQQPDDRDNREH